MLLGLEITFPLILNDTYRTIWSVITRRARKNDNKCKHLSNFLALTLRVLLVFININLCNTQKSFPLLLRLGTFSWHAVCITSTADEIWSSHVDYYVVVDVLGLWRDVYLQVDADVSEKHTVSIFRGWSDKEGKQRSCFRTWRGRAEGREPIREREYGNWSPWEPQISTGPQFLYSLSLIGSLPSALALQVL
jgi:hypothetical protein